MNKQHSKYTFKGHGDAITSLAFSPDGKRLLSLGRDDRAILWNVEAGIIQNITLPKGWADFRLFPNADKVATDEGIWDAETGELIRRHRKEGILACSPDGNFAVNNRYADNPDSPGTMLCQYFLFDLRTGRTRTKFWEYSTAEQTYSAEEFVFSPDGDYLAFAVSDYEGDACTIYAYELKTRLLSTKRIPAHFPKLFWTKSPSSTRLTAVSRGGTRIWDAENGELLQSVSERPYPSAREVSLSPDGRLLARATTDTDGCVEVYNVAEKRLLWKQSLHCGWIRTLVFTRDSRKLASAGDDLAIYVAQAETGEPAQTLVGRMPQVNALSFTTEGDCLSALYNDNSARLWELEPRALKRQNRMSMEPVTHLGELNSQKALHYWNLPFKELPVYSDERPLSVQSISLDGALVALKSPRIMRYEVERLDQKLEQTAVSDEERSARASLAEQSLVSALRGTEDNHKIVIWNIETQSALCTISAPKIHDCVILPDNRRCAISHVESVTIYALATGEVLQKLAFDHDLDQVYGGDLTLSSDGNLLAHVEYLGAIRIWDLQTGKRLDTDASAEDGLDIAFFPDGERIITSLPHEEYAWIWRLSSKSKPRRLEGHLSSVRAVACSPDGKLVATGAQDGAVKVWDARSGTLLATYQALPEAEAWVIHTPEGEVTGSPGAEVYLMENIER